MHELKTWVNNSKYQQCSIRSTKAWNEVAVMFFYHADTGPHLNRKQVYVIWLWMIQFSVQTQIWNPLLTVLLKIIFKVFLETLQTFLTTRQSSQKKRSTQILCYQWTWTLLSTSLSCQNRIFQFSTNQIWKSTATATIFSFPTNLFSKLRKSKLKRSHQYCQRFENFKLKKMAKSIPPPSQVLKKRTNCSTIKLKT